MRLKNMHINKTDKLKMNGESYTTLYLRWRIKK